MAGRDSAHHQSEEKCKEIFSQISEYLDMKLPADVCREIEEHMSGCAPCVEFVDSLRKTIQLCRRYRPEEMPDPIRDSAKQELMEAYRKAITRQARPRSAGSQV